VSQLPTSVTSGNVRPEDLDAFRQARILLLMERLVSLQPDAALDIERLAYYDFFVANPFLLPLTEGAAATLGLAGFIKANLSYQSASQRFANNRARMQFDLATLVARGLLVSEVVGKRVAYRPIPSGIGVAANFRSLYAMGYRRSAEIILQVIRKLSDTRLRAAAKEWLKADALMVDLYDIEATL
jgi:hypothetical protein